MFENLTGKLNAIFEKLKKRGLLTEELVNDALREVRVALLEADVALPVVRDFINAVREKAVGQEVLQAVSPGQQVVKIVHDHLVEFLGPECNEFLIKAKAPAVLLMVGLQGSGKTTMTGKIAKYLTEKQKQKILVASLDTRRPAAQEQLAILAEQVGVESLPIVKSEDPLQITKRALERARLGVFDVVILDTAGRTVLDDELMAEIVQVKKISDPAEILLVADAMTGQSALNVAQAFDQAVDITGICLTRIDGDARGGAALSMHHVTHKPIKLLGIGEKIDALECFYPKRLADRILGMGDVVSLVEKAMQAVDKSEAEKLEQRIMKGKFDLNDMASQLRQVNKMGSISSMMNMIPGMSKFKDKIPEGHMDDKIVGRQLAIISSMTKEERRKVKIINGSRRRRIAQGAGVTVEQVNKLLKQFQQMEGMMKKVSKLGKAGLMRSGLAGLMGR